MTGKNHLLLSYESFIGSVPEGARGDAVNMYIRSSFKRIYISGFVFFVISVFSITRDIFVGFYNRSEEPTNILNLIALSLLLLSSVIMIGLGTADNKKPLSIGMYKMCHWIYYISVGVSLTILVYSEFVRGNYVMFEQFYWIFFAVVPLMHLKSNFINLAISAAVYVFDFILAYQNRSILLEDFIYFLPVLCAFGVFGLYLRNYYMHNIIYTLRNRQLTEQLRSRSRIDPLTGCLNRYVMHEHFELLRDSSNEITVFMFDIDNFKNYNDGFTHLKGDECLTIVSECAMRICTKYKVKLFRYGGEEFVVLAKKMNKDEVVALAREIVESINALHIDMPEPFSELRPYVTVSLGAAIVSVNSASSMKDTIMEVDKQLYIAKSLGKNCVCFLDERYPKQEAADQNM